MEVLCLVLSVLAVLVSLGSLSFFRSSRPSLTSLKEFSETLEEFRGEFKRFKREIGDEWEAADHRLRSIAGRIDRARRKDAKEQPADGEGEQPGEPLDEAAINRALLRSRGINL